MYSVSGKLYYMGGFQPFQGPALVVSNQLTIFDPLTGTWTNGVPMPVPRAFYAGGVINGKIYVTAGEQDGGGGLRPPDLDIYDPTTGTWAVGTPDPNPRRSSASTALNGKLYIIGGDTGGSSATNSVDVYDATTNTWGTETALPVNINHATAQASNGKIYVVGGLVNGTTLSTTTYVLDSVTHTWGVEAGLNQPRSELGSAILNGVIYATGGAGGGNAHEAFITSVSALVVTPATDIATSGVQGQSFSPASFPYQLSSSSGSVNYSISGIPSWLTPTFTTGTVPPTVTDTFSVNACGFSPGTYTATITFTNTSSGQGNTTRTATLTVNPGTKNACKNGGWQKFTCSPGPFKNQGQCVSFFPK